MATAEIKSVDPVVVLTLTQEEARYLYELTGRFPYKQGELNASVYDAINRLITSIQYSSLAVHAADDAINFIRERG